MGDFIVYNDPKHSPEVPSSVTELRKAVMFLTEKIHVLQKLPSGLGWSAILVVSSMLMNKQYIFNMVP